MSLTFAGSPFNYLPGTRRPIQVLPNDRVRASDFAIGPNRFPTSAQNRLFDITRFQYPAPFTPGTLGDPDGVFNLQNSATFGRHSGTRGSFSDVGGRLHSFLVLRLEW